MIVQRNVNKTIDPRAFDLLIDESFIRQGDLIKAIQDSLQQGIELEDLLIRQYRVPKAAIGKALSRFFECPYIPYDERMVVDPQLIKDLSHDYLWKHVWVPLKAHGSVLDVLIDDPHDIVRGHDIQRAFPGMTIRYAVALKGDIKRFLQSTIGMTDTGSIEDTLGELVHEARAEESLAGDVDAIDENDSAIVRLANQIIVEAYRQEASDIHIEPYSDRKETAIRLRVDGTCSTYMRIPAAYRRALVSRIKIMSNLDIAERRKPQDGKLRFRLNRDREIEVRVATMPTAGNNEDIVMRLLTAKEPMPLEAMEFAPSTLAGLGSDRQASWDSLVRRPDRIGKDDDAPRSSSSPEHRCQENLDGRGPDRDHTGRTQAGAGAAQNRIHVCCGVAVVSSSRSGCDHDRRNAG
jgi:hypothetical protein